MTNSIPLHASRLFTGPPSPGLQHYRDQARLAWFDRMALALQDAERVFSKLSSADDEVDCLERIREVLKGVEHL